MNDNVFLGPDITARICSLTDPVSSSTSSIYHLTDSIIILSNGYMFWGVLCSSKVGSSPDHEGGPSHGSLYHLYVYLYWSTDRTPGYGTTVWWLAVPGPPRRRRPDTTSPAAAQIARRSPLIGRAAAAAWQSRPLIGPHVTGLGHPRVSRKLGEKGSIDR